MESSAVLRLIIAMMIFGTVGVFVKNIPLASGEIALFRAVIATVAILLYQLIRQKNMNYLQIKSDLPWLLASGVAMGFNWIFLFEAYRYTSISLATLSYYFAPILVMLLCPFLFKEKLNLKQICCFVVATIGLVLIIGVSSGEAENHLLGICFGLAAASLYATVILLNKFVKKVDGVERTLLQFFAAILVLCPYVYMTSGIHINTLDFIGLTNMIILGLVHTGFAYCLYLASIKSLTGQKVAILSYIDPFIAILISVAILHEPMQGLQVVGGILILGSTLWSELK